jgi:hypothetical protein
MTAPAGSPIRFSGWLFTRAFLWALGTRARVEKELAVKARRLILCQRDEEPRGSPLFNLIRIVRRRGNFAAAICCASLP